MTSRRTLTVGLTAAALLLTPAAVAVGGSAPSTTGATERLGVTQAAEQAAKRRDTNIRFLSFDHTKPHMARARVKGQVTVQTPAGRRAVKGLWVRLYRKFNGSNGWDLIAGKRVGRGAYARFVFRPQARANARYKVNFRGNSRLSGSNGVTSVLVHRRFDPTLADGTGRFHGHMSPRYRHRFVILQKRACGRCSWEPVRGDRTDRRSNWDFKVSAPRHGRWWWRVTTAPTPRFIRSSSGVFTTERA